jgi:ubiquinone/menaquinone biosynthesis C-methylase UbiE
VSFDSLAPLYRTLETIVFGSALQRARVALLDETRGCKAALLVGEGNGRFLAALIAAQRDIRITCVEQSSKMIELARASLSNSNRVHFIQANVLAVEMGTVHDLIVTNFFLDCFNDEQLAKVIAKLAAIATDDAKWIVTDFTAAWQGKPLVAIMYLFFRIVAGISGSHLPDYAPVLAQHGFQCVTARSFFAGIVRTEMWRRSAKN